VNPGTLHTSWLTSRRLADTDAADDAAACDLLATAAATGPLLVVVVVVVVVVVAAELVCAPLVLALPMLNPDTQDNTRLCQ